jgi:uncharacterized protein
MQYRTTFPRPIREIMTQWIPMPDGRRLAARIWLPEDAERDPVPAVLEYLPYRRRDGTTYRDSTTQPWLAGHGYAAVRLDIRGTGDSEGIMRDEYDLPELQDGAETIQWLASQPWCNGSVGLWGISWGGINALQIAALAPPALKAIMPMGFIDDRYNGDCHFMGGCLLEGNMSWGHSLFAGLARPPDPDVVGQSWRQQWLERLESITPPIATWLAHQRRDGYWQAGSVCQDYGRIKAAVYAISGWQDSYSRSVLPLIENLRVPRKALIGPWAHDWPHTARPGPAIGFMQEALRWWDQWLKGIDTGIMDEPMVRVWMSDWVKPRKLVEDWPGRWVGERHWPPRTRAASTLALTAGGLIRKQAATDETFTVRSPQTTGLRSGYQCSYGSGPDLSDDQRLDDGQSLCFDSAPLDEPLEFLGEPVVDLDIAADQPQALLAVRLCDVAPDGSSLRVTYGLLNLAHRDSDEKPSPLVPGQRYKLSVRLCAMAYAFPKGHRIRLALSTAYWPLVWPSPVQATVTLHGKASALHLPVREPDASLDDTLAHFGEAEGSAPQALVELRPKQTDRSQDRIEEEMGDGRVTLFRTRDRGAWRTTDTNVEYDATGLLKFSIQAEDPLAAKQEFSLTSTLGRPGWRIRTETTTEFTATATAFLLQAKLTAFLDDQPVFDRSWDYRIDRDNM